MSEAILKQVVRRLASLSCIYRIHIVFTVALVSLLLYNPGARRQAMFELNYIYTTDEIAELLRVHPQTVKRWLRAGQMRGALLADRTGWRVLGRDLQAFWDARLNDGGEIDGGQQEEKETAR
jgi:excisionase family DNA binding protein